MSFLSLGRHWKYLRYVLVHKWYVFRAGCTLGIPWLALLHDNSKFLPDEWGPYASHFYEPDGSKKTRKAADGFYDDEPDDLAFDRAWLSHIRRNKHHPQHWVRGVRAPCNISDHDRVTLLEDDGGSRCLTCGIRGVPNYQSPDWTIREMPLRYRLEMLADWIGAGAAQGTPDTLGWYASRGKNHPFGPETRAWVEQRLGRAAPGLSAPAPSTTPSC
jgi:hypothetical protein